MISYNTILKLPFSDIFLLYFNYTSTYPKLPQVTIPDGELVSDLIESLEGNNVTLCMEVPLEVVNI